MLLNFKDMKDMKTLYSLMKKFEKIEKPFVVVSLGHNYNFFKTVITKKTLVSVKSTWKFEIAFSWEIEKKNFLLVRIKLCWYSGMHLVFSARAFEEAFDLLQNSPTFVNLSW